MEYINYYLIDVLFGKTIFMDFRLKKRLKKKKKIITQLILHFILVVTIKRFQICTSKIQDWSTFFNYWRVSPRVLFSLSEDQMCFFYWVLRLNFFNWLSFFYKLISIKAKSENHFCKTSESICEWNGTFRISRCSKRCFSKLASVIKFLCEQSVVVGRSWKHYTWRIDVRTLIKLF